MLDIKKIKENPDAVKAGLKAKEVDCDATVDKILVLDERIRALKTASEGKTAQKNKLSKENGKLFGQKKAAEKRGEDTAAIEAAIAENNAKSVQLDKDVADELAELAELQVEFKTAMLSLPNLPDPDLLPGGKENNQPLKYFGEPHKFDFTPKHHVDLCQDLGLIDYERGVKLAGTGNWMYTGLGARLEWALLNYFIDCHIADGYEFILPPHMLEYQCGETAGQFPKFADEVYKIANPTDDRVHYMLPTAEAALASSETSRKESAGTSLKRGEISRFRRPTSQSMHRTFRFCSASAEAMPAQTDVLPVPPLPETMAYVSPTGNPPYIVWVHYKA